MSLATASREELAWAAGLFEGEGCVSRAKRRGDRFATDLSLGMTDEDVVRRFQQIVGVGSVRGPYGPYPHRPREKAIWQWKTARFEDTQAIIAALWPWLHSRRRTKIVETMTAVLEKKPIRQYARVGQCGRGHKRVGDNAYQNAKGQWVCRVCRRRNERNQRAICF